MPELERCALAYWFALEWPRSKPRADHRVRLQDLCEVLKLAHAALISLDEAARDDLADWEKVEATEDGDTFAIDHTPADTTKMGLSDHIARAEALGAPRRRGVVTKPTSLVILDLVGSVLGERPEMKDATLARLAEAVIAPVVETWNDRLPQTSAGGTSKPALASHPDYYERVRWARKEIEWQQARAAAMAHLGGFADTEDLCDV